MSEPLILGIESTCDESSASILRGPREILVNVVKSQIKEHEMFGGVVPEVASRLHLKYLCPALKQALERTEVGMDDIDLIAVSSEPGLIGCLLVGTTLAKSLAYLYDKPIVMVDHLHAHLLAPDIEEEMKFPCIGGIFSGGHCNIYYGESYNQWTLLTRTRDDAPGEAFDKVAKLMDLSYPGGPSVQRFAGEADSLDKFSLPLPRPKSLEGDFSFSGIKTAVLYLLKGMQGKAPIAKEDWPWLAAAFQNQVAVALSQGCFDAAKAKDVEHVYVGGGVAANARLREVMHADGEKHGISVSFPSLPLCMDNGAMVARAGLSKYLESGADDLRHDVASRSTLGVSV